MKQRISALKAAFIMVFAVCFLKSAAQVEQAAPQTITESSLVKDGNRMEAHIGLSLADMKVSSNQGVVLMPAIVNLQDTLYLPNLGVYGRRRYIHYQRGDGPKADVVFSASEAPRTYDYSAYAQYEPWMDGATLMVFSRSFGCCNTTQDASDTSLARYLPLVRFEKADIYMRPQTAGLGLKTGQISGSAWVQFPVNRTEIFPDLYNNPQELGKIRASIDSVRNDEDITITLLSLKGYASPESPYKHNADLARGRTASVKEYVQNLYRFDDSLMTTDYEPEDWQGLREKVAQSGMEHKNEILEIIDSSLEPDAREAAIKKKYPQEYKFMLMEWYPVLRHTDYRIEYIVRHFTEPAEALRIFRTAPGKLDIGEFYLASEAITDPVELEELWDTAVRLFPTDQTANTNAAIIALNRGNLELADRFLQRAGTSAEADYSRGVLNVYRDDYQEARKYFNSALKAGLQEAEDALRQLDLIQERGRLK